MLGLTPLHIAVVNQHINLVQHLISRGGDVATPRVTGLYFRKRIGGLLYYGNSDAHIKHVCEMICIVKNISFFQFPGEHILSFAACTGNKDIISMIINAGASTRVQDHRGIYSILFRFEWFSAFPRLHVFHFSCLLSRKHSASHFDSAAQQDNCVPGH